MEIRASYGVQETRWDHPGFPKYQYYSARYRALNKYQIIYIFPNAKSVHSNMAIVIAQPVIPVYVYFFAKAQHIHKHKCDIECKSENKAYQDKERSVKNGCSTHCHQCKLPTPNSQLPPTPVFFLFFFFFSLYDNPEQVQSVEANSHWYLPSQAVRKAINNTRAM